MASYTLVTPFSLAGPVLQPGTVLGDFSNTPTIYPTQMPASFGFLDIDLPRQILHDFRGNEFYGQFNLGQQFDMAVESGGDTYDICGTESFRKYDEEIRLQVGTGTFTKRTRKDYKPFMVPGEEEDDPEVFAGYFTVVETELLFDDDLGGFYVTQTRTTGADRKTVWEYLGDSTPGGSPKFTVVGSLQLTDGVTQAMLSEYAEAWQSELSGADDEIFDAIAVGAADGFTYAYAYTLTQTITGQNAHIAAGLAVVRDWEVQADEPLEEGGPPEYTLDGVGVWYDSQTRGNKPVAYEEGFTACVGNDIYGNGFSRIQLVGLIDEKIWKDGYGIYDQDQNALSEVPWMESAQLAGFEIENEGWLSRGSFTSADGRTYRVTIVRREDGSPDVEIDQVVVVPGEPAEYFFGLVEDLADSYIPVVSTVELFDGEAWSVIDGNVLEMISAKPGPGVLLLHDRKQRRGQRWGHFEFEPQDPEPTTSAGQRRYRLKTLRKEARP